MFLKINMSNALNGMKWDCLYEYVKSGTGTEVSDYCVQFLRSCNTTPFNINVVRVEIYIYVPNYAYYRSGLYVGIASSRTKIIITTKKKLI